MPATPHAYRQSRSQSKSASGATRDDAMLLVELAQWGSMLNLGGASKVIFSDDFDPDSADAYDDPIQATLMFYETIGTLVKNGLLNRELVLDWLWVTGSWERVAP